MIRNGFIKTVDGDWYSLANIDSIKIRKSDPYPECTLDNRWEIRAFFEVEEESNDNFLVIEDDFDTSIGAHNRLFCIMNGER